MSNTPKPLLISIVGPTAIGKTAVAIELALWLGTEIISADSRQFYREMTVGTAKPSKEELALVPHHFIDSHSIDVRYSAGEFGRDATQKVIQLHKQNKAVIAVGGSGLYLKGIWEGFDDMPEVDPEVRRALNKMLEYEGLEPLLKELEKRDPDYFHQVDRNNGQRIVRALEIIRSSGKPFSSFRKNETKELPYSNLKIGLDDEREVLFDRINRRMDQMIEQGLFSEAESLFDYRDHNALQTVGYSEIYGYMDGDYDKEEAIRLLKRNSRRYAKRQLTWFRRYDDINWFAPNQIMDVKNLIEKNL